MPLFSFVNDSLLPADDAVVQISDLAVQRGFGVFDFFKTLGGKPIFLDEHLDRFYASAGRLRLDPGKSRKELKEMIAQLLMRNGIPDAGVRLTLTGGYSTDGYNPARPNLLISQHPLTTPIGAELNRSCRLMTYPHMRQLPDVKSIDYLMAIWLQPVLREKGADDVLYIWDRMITECPRANFFLVTADGTLVTPGRGVLRGITRMKLIEAVKGHMAVEERDLSIDEIKGANEAFITSTTKHLLPVTEIDGIAVGDGKIGSVSKRLSWELYKLVTQGGLRQAD